MSFKHTFILLTIAALLVACGGKNENTELKQKVLVKAKNVFAVLPDKMPGAENDTPALVALGEKLYFEEALSENKTQSCNTCHDINGKNAGVDNLPVSPGDRGEDGTRNSPTVLNAGFHFRQFWDGREPDLKAQAGGQLLNPIEMALADEKMAEDRINEIPEYKALFKAAFPEGEGNATFDGITTAIAAFERTLITKDRFDDFMNGDLSALDETETRGLDLFISTGCITCHTGALLGGNMYQKTGLIKPYSNAKDLGRFEVTKNEADKFMFKVPSLRNVGLTAPYLHDGSHESLRETIKLMADIQLGKQLDNMQALQIEKFLHSLSDKERVASGSAK